MTQEAIRKADLAAKRTKRWREKKIATAKEAAEKKRQMENEAKKM